MKLRPLIALLTFAFAPVVRADVLLAPLPPTPSAAQLAWQEAELGLYVRLDLPTLTGGSSDPKRFNPPALDPVAWAKAAVDLGAQRMVLSANDRDGFCYWPTATTPFSIAATPWREGHGDLVRAFVDAGRATHLAVGFSVTGYEHGKAVSDERLRAMLHELLTQYGPIGEIRLDGAGGEGNGALPVFDPLRIAAQPHRDWPAIIAVIRRDQPEAIIVSNIGPDARWNGNNIGHCGNPLWSPFTPSALPGPELTNKTELNLLNFGDPNGHSWVPGEAFVPLRASWTWHPGEDLKVITLDRLFSAYCKSIGRNAALLLSVPVDDHGALPEADVTRLRELHERVVHVFGQNLAKGARATASSVRTNGPDFAASNLTDGNPATIWAAADGATGGDTIELEFAQPVSFNTLELREPIVYGQRITNFHVETNDGTGWIVLVSGNGVGRRKIERFTKLTTASKLRLVIEHAHAAPVLSEIGLYKE